MPTQSFWNYVTRPQSLFDNDFSSLLWVHKTQTIMPNSSFLFLLTTCLRCLRDPPLPVDLV